MLRFPRIPKAVDATNEIIDSPNMNENVCEICGDIGYLHRIKICSKCKSREHIYCRKSYGYVPEKVWLCEKCELVITASPQSEQKDIHESLYPEGNIASQVLRNARRYGKVYCKRNKEAPCADAENVELVNALPEGNKIKGPAWDSCWKGNFKVLATGTLSEVNLQISAHTPDRALHKVIGFSERMPVVLSFELLRRSVVWTDIFQDYCPSKDDIGLYLLSGGINRSEEYASLVEFLKASDLVLKTCIDDVQLLVFSSNCLSDDSQRWGGEYFLWGIFRRIKKHKADNKAHDKLPLPAQPSGLVIYSGEGTSEDTSSDMEIDMIGGIEVGIPDIPIPREPSSTTTNGNFATQPQVPPGIRMDFPPGFKVFLHAGNKRV